MRHALCTLCAILGTGGAMPVAAPPPAPPPPAPTAPTFATVKDGRVMGYVDAAKGNKRVFRGIPYAMPVVGDRRWRDAEPAAPWNGTLNATRFGPVCLQPMDGGWNTQEGKDNMSEDCLYLNVVAPAAATAKGRAAKSYPVVVYLHAGEFHYGSASDRESDWPFADDVILVTPNSRLGPFGFLASADLAARTKDGSTGNYGIADQRLALRWVRDNIGAFGGNASNVIIMGESSGGTSVAAHLVSRASWWLFHKAVLESPGLTQTKTMADAEANYAYVRAALLHLRSDGCERDDGQYVDYPGVALGGFRHHEEPLPGGGINVSYAQAGQECDRNSACAGFMIEEHAASASASAYTKVSLHAKTSTIGAGYLHLPPGSQVTSSLKAAAGGEQGVECVTRASAADLNTVTDFLPRGDTFETDAFAPVIDGVALSTDIVSLIAAKQLAPDVPVLTGSNMDEGTIFMMLTPRLTCQASASDFGEWATAFYGASLGGAVTAAYAPEDLRAPIPECKRYPEGIRRGSGDSGGTASPPASSPPSSSPPASGEYYMAAMRSAGDYAITCRVRDAARALATTGHPVFTYYFAHTPAYSENYQDLITLGAFHGAEVPFVFGDGFELRGDAEVALSNAMGCYWRNFVHTGNPNGRADAMAPNASPCAALNGSLPKWPQFVGSAARGTRPSETSPFERSTRETTMVLDVGDRLRPEVGLKDGKCDVFAGAHRGRGRQYPLSAPASLAANWQR